jgi:N-dimethylarginine dimethylaminohydrolase
MTASPLIMMVDPAHYEVSYQINPWMEPGTWAADSQANTERARASFAALRSALTGAGARVTTVAGTAGLPDMVFPANAAVVLDRRVLVARFAWPQRQGETDAFVETFAALARHNIIEEVATFPEDSVHEGAGDAIWDQRRRFFWAGHGQRTNLAGVHAVEDFFRQKTVRLELATPDYYHLDTCFCPLSGGHVLYYPKAFTEEGLRTIEAHVTPELRIVASDEDAAALCVNAVNLGRTVVMAKAPPALRARLEAAGYEVREVDLGPFILSGGAAYCMTLRLDRTSDPA